MKLNRFAKKVTSIIAIPLCLLQQLPLQNAWAYTAPQATVMPQANSMGSLEIPKEFGSLEAMHLSNQGAPILVHIQSAHGSYEAQKNVQALLSTLTSKYNFKTLFLEGASGGLHPEFFRFFPEDRELNLKIADSLARKAELTGPELFLIEADQKNPKSQVRAHGIEDAGAYRENRQAFQQVLRARDKTENFLNDMNSQIDRLTAPYLNSALKNYLRRLEAHETQNGDILGWLHFLKEQARKHLDIDFEDAFYQKDWPMLVRFARLEKIETGMDRSALEQEKEVFLEKLKALKIDSKLIQKTADLLVFSNGKSEVKEPSYPEILDTLGNLAVNLPKDFAFTSFQNIKFYMQYLLIKNELNNGSVIEELERLESSLGETMAKTETEKKLWVLFKDYRLLKKLFALELTQKDHEKIGQNQSGDSPSQMVKKFEKINQAKRVKNIRFSHLEEIDRLYTLALAFYAGAKQRDSRMADNLLKQMQASHENRAIVVTGGFHSEGMKQYFENKGFSYYLLSPRITQIGDNRAYHHAMLEINDSVKKSHIENILKLQTFQDMINQGANPDHIREAIVKALIKNVEAAKLFAVQAQPYGIRTVSNPKNPGIIDIHVGNNRILQIHLPQGGAGARSEARSNKNQAKLRVETLEDRLVPATPTQPDALFNEPLISTVQATETIPIVQVIQSASILSNPSYTIADITPLPGAPIVDAYGWNGATASASPTSRGMTVNFNTGIDIMAGAAATFRFDDYGTPGIETADLSGLSKLVFGYEGTPGQVKVELVSIVNGQEVKAWDYLSGITSGTEKALGITMTDFNGINQIDLHKIRMINIIVVGPNQSGQLTINQLPAISPSATLTTLMTSEAQSVSVKEPLVSTAATTSAAQYSDMPVTNPNLTAKIIKSGKQDTVQITNSATNLTFKYNYTKGTVESAQVYEGFAVVNLTNGAVDLIQNTFTDRKNQGVKTSLQGNDVFALGVYPDKSLDIRLNTSTSNMLRIYTVNTNGQIVGQREEAAGLTPLPLLSGWTRMTSNPNYAGKLEYNGPYIYAKLMNLITGEVKTMGSASDNSGYSVGIADVSPDSLAVIVVYSGPTSAVHVTSIANPSTFLRIDGSFESLSFQPGYATIETSAKTVKVDLNTFTAVPSLSVLDERNKVTVMDQNGNVIFTADYSTLDFLRPVESARIVTVGGETMLVVDLGIGKIDIFNLNNPMPLRIDEQVLNGAMKDANGNLEVRALAASKLADNVYTINTSTLEVLQVRTVDYPTVTVSGSDLSQVNVSSDLLHSFGIQMAGAESAGSRTRNFEIENVIYQDASWNEGAGASFDSFAGDSPTIETGVIPQTFTIGIFTTAEQLRFEVVSVDTATKAETKYSVMLDTIPFTFNTFTLSRDLFQAQGVDTDHTRIFYTLNPNPNEMAYTQFYVTPSALPEFQAEDADYRVMTLNGTQMIVMIPKRPELGRTEIVNLVYRFWELDSSTVKITGMRMVPSAQGSLLEVTVEGSQNESGAPLTTQRGYFEIKSPDPLAPISSTYVRGMTTPDDRFFISFREPSVHWALGTSEEQNMISIQELATGATKNFTIDSRQTLPDIPAPARTIVNNTYAITSTLHYEAPGIGVGFNRITIINLIDDTIRTVDIAVSVGQYTTGLSFKSGYFTDETHAVLLFQDGSSYTITMESHSLLDVSPSSPSLQISPDGQHQVSRENGFLVLRDVAGNVQGSVQVEGGVVYLNNFTVTNTGAIYTSNERGNLIFKKIPFSNFTSSGQTSVVPPYGTSGSGSIQFYIEAPGIARIIGNDGVTRWINLETNVVLAPADANYVVVTVVPTLAEEAPAAGAAVTSLAASSTTVSSADGKFTVTGSGNAYTINNADGSVLLTSANEVSSVTEPANSYGSTFIDYIATGPFVWNLDSSLKSFVTLQSGQTAVLSDELSIRSGGFREPMQDLPNFIEINGEFVPLTVTQVGSNPIGWPQYQISFIVPQLKGDGTDKIEFLSPYDSTHTLSLEYAINANATIWAKFNGSAAYSPDQPKSNILFTSALGNAIVATGLADNANIQDWRFDATGTKLIITTDIQTVIINVPVNLLTPSAPEVSQPPVSNTDLSSQITTPGRGKKQQDLLTITNAATGASIAYAYPKGSIQNVQLTKTFAAVDLNNGTVSLIINDFTHSANKGIQVSLTGESVAKLGVFTNGNIEVMVTTQTPGTHTVYVVSPQGQILSTKTITAPIAEISSLEDAMVEFDGMLAEFDAMLQEAEKKLGSGGSSKLRSEVRKQLALALLITDKMLPLASPSAALAREAGEITREILFKERLHPAIPENGFVHNQRRIDMALSGIGVKANVPYAYILGSGFAIEDDALGFVREVFGSTTPMAVIVKTPQEKRIVEAFNKKLKPAEKFLIANSAGAAAVALRKQIEDLVNRAGGMRPFTLQAIINEKESDLARALKAAGIRNPIILQQSQFKAMVEMSGVQMLTSQFERFKAEAMKFAESA